jgi:phosphohistidine swiveling domain-containing protein
VLEAKSADLPPGTLAGTAASAGVVEGLARVVTDPGNDVLLAGEILVAPFTDPGWTPLFVHAAGVVTEVGGMMTHGAVVAREYGIPAVVSVASAVEHIKTGRGSASTGRAASSRSWRSREDRRSRDGPDGQWPRRPGIHDDPARSRRTFSLPFGIPWTCARPMTSRSRQWRTPRAASRPRSDEARAWTALR